jgi:hypothetical protein
MYKCCPIINDDQVGFYFINLMRYNQFFNIIIFVILSNALMLFILLTFFRALNNYNVVYEKRVEEQKIFADPFSEASQKRIAEQIRFV